MTRNVTISGTYGARGERIGRIVAERLDLPFLDRVIPSVVARKMHMSDESAEAFDERAPSRWERFAAAFAELTPSPGVITPPAGHLESPESFRSGTESVLREAADTTGAVILGRAGMVVLADRPGVLSVRLDGPVEARIAQAISDGIDEKAARQLQRDLDRSRESYVNFFYGVNQDDQHLYHLVIDSTALSVDVCVELILTAAADRFDST